MFEHSLIESSNKKPGTRRGAATVLSFANQGAIIGILVLLPLLFVQALPTHTLLTELVAPPPPPPPPPPPAAAAEVRPRAVKTVTDTGELHTPTRIPKKVMKIEDVEQASAAPPPGAVTGGVPGGVAGGQIGGVLGGVLASTPVAVPKIAAPQRVRVSQGVTQGLLQHKVEPQYPALARSARIQGTVILHALIGKDGQVKNLQLVSGHPMLAKAALDAVRQWKYKPYSLNGQPTEIETEVTVNFTLNG